MITTDDGLRAVCEAASTASAVALDTEFVRTRTYYPQLGLLQLFDGQQVSLIDPLTINDWAPMRDLLLNQDVTKYLHAGSEDLEVFLNAFNLMPQPLIDTQILAAFCGRPMSWGFASMVEEYSGVALDKSESRTDWLARPLTERQCEYAAADVWYLLPIASQLMAETDRAGSSVVRRWSTRPRPGAISATPGSCVPASWVVCSCWRSGACAKRARATWR
ncbi:ribonuclease D [Klebsiella pneumoniae]|nr:ribonuclease D [Klebsiella pneumoniae]